MEPQYWWPHYESARAYAGCAERFHRNRPLKTNLEFIFSYLLDTLLTLCNYKYGAHLFVNPNLPEAHYMAFGARRVVDSSYKRATIPEREEWNESDWEAVKALLQRQRDEHEFHGGPSMSDASEETLNEIAARFGTHVEHPAPCLIIPFDHGVWKLGTFVLWGTRNPQHSTRKATDETLRGWISSYYRYLGKFLSREFTITADTYLPSFYASGWSKVAILFADIRDFTPLTEMIRNREGILAGNTDNLLQGFLKDYCEAMAEIIQAGGRGRIDKFLGDGIMAIFGEHETDPSKAVCRAIHAAARMIVKFRELRPIWKAQVFGGKYEYEYNETVEPRLGIGINFGTVLFDYVGDDRHREYTAVGDHVNFAQRLEASAARTDPDTKESREPILLSQTAYLCAKQWLKGDPKPRVWPLTAKGKGRGYEAFGIQPSTFDTTFYNASERSGDWETIRKGPR